jgi:hypothetical protein
MPLRRAAPTTEIVDRMRSQLTPLEKAVHLHHLMGQREDTMRHLRYRMRLLRSQLNTLRRDIALKYKHLR